MFPELYYFFRCTLLGNMRNNFVIQEEMLIFAVDMYRSLFRCGIVFRIVKCNGVCDEEFMEEVCAGGVVDVVCQF